MNRVDVRGIRRKQILGATKRLVAEQGWTEVSILDIGRAAGVSSGVITYHFKNKDEIMFALLEEILGQIKAHSYIAAPGAYTLESDISTFLSLLDSLQEADPDFPALLIQLVAASLHRPKIAKRLHSIFNAARQQKIAEWKALGVVSEHGDDGLVLVSLLHSAILGMVLGKLFMGIDLPSGRLRPELQRMLLACYSSAPPASPAAAR